MATPSEIPIGSYLADGLFVFKRNIVVIVLVLLCLRGLTRRYASPLSRYPGPLLASFTRLWKVWSTYNGHTHSDHIELHKKYGM